MDEKKFSSPINANIVKKYYVWGNQEKWLVKVENQNGRLWQVKQKEKNEKWKRFKAKTWKGDLNHKKKERKKKKEKCQVENLKMRLDQENRFLDWKPERTV